MYPTIGEFLSLTLRHLGWRRISSVPLRFRLHHLQEKPWSLLCLLAGHQAGFYVP
jgi:hypothetical protein